MRGEPGLAQRLHQRLSLAPQGSGGSETPVGGRFRDLREDRAHLPGSGHRAMGSDDP